MQDTSERASRFDLVLELYSDATVSVVAGETLADAWRTARDTWPSIDASHDDGDVACVLDVDGRAVVLLPRDVTIDVLAHEAVHVAAWILRTRGMPFSIKNEEGVAYLVQWFVRHAWPLLLATPLPAPAVNASPSASASASP